MIFHALREIFNFKANFFLIRIISHNYIDFAPESIVNGIFDKSGCALPEVSLIWDDHLGYIIGLVLIKVIQQSYFDLRVVLNFKKGLLYKHINALMEVKNILTPFELSMKQLVPIAKLLNLRRCKLARSLCFLNQLNQTLDFLFFWKTSALIPTFNQTWKIRVASYFI